MQVNSAQFRMARAALRWSLEEAASASGVHRNTILRIEQGEASHGPTIAAVVRAYEAEGVRFGENGGVEFTPEEDRRMMPEM